LQTTLSHGLGKSLDGALTLGGGASGGHLPIQKQFYLGGVQTVRGQRAGAAIGDSFWMTSAEIGSRSVGFRKIVFADLAGPGLVIALTPRTSAQRRWRGRIIYGRPHSHRSRQGIYPEKSVRANLYVEARF